MKKTSLLNIALSETIAGLGHGDTLVISDAGLPVPPETRRIDLALTGNVPRFIETLRIVLAEMQVESVIMAKETEQVSPHILAEVQKLLPNATIELMPHTTFKEMTREARAVVRTGEFTKYANVILKAGVVF